MARITNLRELRPRITVFGVGGAGGNAINNMITAGLQGVDFIVANTDAQALTTSKAARTLQMGIQVTEGLGAGSQPEVGRAAAEEAIDAIREHVNGAHMVFVTAGMGGGTGTGAAPIIAKAAHELGILTVGVVTKPFHFEGKRRMRLAEAGIIELQKVVDTLLIIPNQNLFRVANEKTTFADAFAMADQVLHSGVACITDLIVKEGLINLDYADVRAIMGEQGRAMMGMGEASGEKRVLTAAETAISNPLIEDPSIKRASGLLISITGGKDLTLFEVDEAASLIREEADPDANIIVGATFDDSLEGTVRVSVVATGIDNTGAAQQIRPAESAPGELAAKLGNNRSHHDRSATATAENASFQPMPTTPSLPEASQIEAPSMAAASIPRAPERIEYITLKQPIGELLLSGQNKIAAQRKPLNDYSEKRRKPLMQRLASVVWA
jgi:cell division protein FtsZ